jgi:hypothetical protein
MHCNFLHLPLTYNQMHTADMKQNRRMRMYQPDTYYKLRRQSTGQTNPLHSSCTLPHLPSNIFLPHTTSTPIRPHLHIYPQDMSCTSLIHWRSQKTCLPHKSCTKRRYPSSNIRMHTPSTRQILMSQTCQLHKLCIRPIQQLQRCQLHMSHKMMLLQ